MIECILAASPEAAQWTGPRLAQSAGPCATVWVAVDNDEVVGMVAVRTAAGEAEILNLAVASAQRRRGMGRLLVEAAIAAARAEGAGRVYLEVRESNAAARSLYAKLDFVESGRRRNYYCGPTEDALILLRTMEQPAVQKAL